MTTIVNEQRATTALIEKYIGSAWDKINAIYQNLDGLLRVLEEFDSWLGVHSTPPTERTNGNPLEDGDRYYNDSTKLKYVWSNGSWRTGDKVTSATIEVVTVQAGDINVGLNTTTINLANEYEPDTNQLYVFIGAAFQISKSVDPTGGYTESSNTQIIFDDALVEGEKVTVITGIPTDILNPNIAVEDAIYFVETVDQVLIPTPTGFSYTPGAGNMKVHINGDLKYANYHYYETSPTSITVVDPLQPGDEIIFEAATIIGNQPEENENLTVLDSHSNDVFYDNREILNIAHAVITRGGNTVADGSGGVYAFDVTYEQSQANGVTVIDPNQTTANQGTGTGNGCWVRQYENEIDPQWWNIPERGMAVLKYLTPIEGDTVRLIGFNEDSQVGGGLFRWNPYRDATDHDGGTVISPLVTVTPGDIGGGWYTAPISGLGCWERQYDLPVQGDWFGIPTGGAVDVSTPLTAAASVGDAVQLRVSDYQVESAVTGTFFSYGVSVVTGTNPSGLSIANAIA